MGFTLGMWLKQRLAFKSTSTIEVLKYNVTAQTSVLASCYSGLLRNHKGSFLSALISYKLFKLRQGSSKADIFSESASPNLERSLALRKTLFVVYWVKLFVRAKCQLSPWQWRNALYSLLHKCSLWYQPDVPCNNGAFSFFLKCTPLF